MGKKKPASAAAVDVSDDAPATPAAAAAPTPPASVPEPETAPEAAAPAPAMTDEEAKAAKRAEIEAKVAAMRLQQEKEAQQKSTYFGEHGGITCDGCGQSPIVGYRYHCRDCANHDVCETCYDDWTKGRVKNQLGKQVVSLKAEDHRFKLHKDKAFSSLVKQKSGGESDAPKGPKVKPNEPCSCGSGKKYKKCCATNEVGKAAMGNNGLKVDVTK